VSENDDSLPLIAVVAGWTSTDTTGMENTLTTWQCHLCGFIYDEATGLSSEGFPPGTRWADIPDTWSCPDCGYAKTDFDMVEISS